MKKLLLDWKNLFLGKAELPLKMRSPTQFVKFSRLREFKTNAKLIKVQVHWRRSSMFIVYVK